MNKTIDQARAMTPFRFAGSAGGLFGVYHAPAGDARPEQAVLLCNPFGQEAIRSHRVFRVLASRFARDGYPTLRFDYHGTGDSDGEGEEASIEQWSNDVLAADAELRRRTGCPRVAWMGLRLGATIAAIASARADQSPEKLVLWDPVVAGGPWLTELAASHRKALEQAFEGAPARVGATGDQTDPDSLAESLGFPLMPAFKAEIAELNPGLFANAVCSRMVFLVGGQQESAARLTQVATGRFDKISCRSVSESNWNSDEAMNSSIVPADVVVAAVNAMDLGSR